jgi:hypothetical protein
MRYPHMCGKKIRSSLHRRYQASNPIIGEKILK